MQQATDGPRSTAFQAASSPGLRAWQAQASNGARPDEAWGVFELQLSGKEVVTGPSLTPML